MEKKTILATRPDFELTTKYISSWAKKVLDFAQEKEVVVFDLDKEKANRQALEAVIREQSPDFIFLNGHGDYDKVCGQNNECLVGADDNEEILSGKVVYALSCRSAGILGKKAVEKGALSYIGYTEDFIFLYDGKQKSFPLQDKIAELFLSPSNQVVFSLLGGCSGREASQNSKDSFLANVKKLLTSEAPKEQKGIVRYLLWDRHHQACWEKKE